MRAEFDRRVIQQVDQLFHAQLTSAVGCTMLFKRERRGGHAVRVTSEAEVKWFIDNHEVQNGHARATDGTHYYWLTTERPNAEAVDRMLNRVFGKPVEQHTFTGQGEDGKPTTVRFVVVGG